jgi:Cu+-exporting ATPase
MKTSKIVQKSAIFGIGGVGLLLGFYFLLLTVVSGWEFTLSQFAEFWHFIVTLAAGFGIQLGLYTYLRNAIRHQDSSGKVVAVSGATSTAAMISCCAHYLTNVVPVLGAAGLIALVAQYQIELFWFGLASNATGILYMGSRVIKFTKAHGVSSPAVADPKNNRDRPVSVSHTGG